jgi:hypothetical protein
VTWWVAGLAVCQVVGCQEASSGSRGALATKDRPVIDDFGLSVITGRRGRKTKDGRLSMCSGSMAIADAVLLRNKE